MKRVVKILYALIFLSSAPALHIKAAFSLKDKKTAAQSQKTTIEMPSAHTNNDLLATIVENSQTLVTQIQNGNRDATERKKALAELVKAENNLSKNATTQLAKDIYAAVKAQTDIITQESKAFSHHRKPLEKYNPTKAEQALMDLALAVKKGTENSAESFVTETHQALERAIIETERITKEANEAILKASAQVGNGTLTPAQAAVIIGKQNHIIAMAQQNLAKAKEAGQKNVAQNDMQASYLSKFATQAYNLGASALAPLKSGYGYSDEEKDIARAIIAELEKQMEQIHADWQTQLQQPGITPAQTNALADKYAAVMEELKNEIYQQQLITGDAMSFNRKLFWGTVAVAGAVGAAYLGHQYFTEKAAELAKEASLEKDFVELEKLELDQQIMRQDQLSWENAAQTAPEIAPSMPVTETSQAPENLVEPVSILPLSSDEQLDTPMEQQKRLQSDNDLSTPEEQSSEPESTSAQPEIVNKDLIDNLAEFGKENQEDTKEILDLINKESLARKEEAAAVQERAQLDKLMEQQEQLQLENDLSSPEEQSSEPEPTIDQTQWWQEQEAAAEQERAQLDKLMEQQEQLELENDLSSPEAPTYEPEPTIDQTQWWQEQEAASTTQKPSIRERVKQPKANQEQSEEPDTGAPTGAI